MKKSFTIGLYLIVAFNTGAQVIDHAGARALFLEAGSDSCKARELFNVLDKQPVEKNAVLLAYKGVAETMLARCTKRNIEKLSVFNSGRRNLERALAMDPLNWEIRFLRFQLQTQIPALLNYNHFREDKPFLLEKLPQAVREEPDKYFMGTVIQILILSGEFSKAENRRLENLISVANESYKSLLTGIKD